MVQYLSCLLPINEDPLIAVHEYENDIIKDGKKKDEAKKHMIHPDIKDYDQLPENTRRYDIIASAFIPFIINGKQQV